MTDKFESRLREALRSIGAVLLMTTGAVSIAVIVIAEMGLSKDTKEIVRPLLGTFMGAFLAFISHRHHQNKKQDDDESAALFLALFVLRAQYDDFIQYRYILISVTSDIEKQYKDGAAAPPWAFIKPFRYTFNPSNTFDVKSMAFLLDGTEGRNLFTQLQFVERTYLELITSYEDVLATAQEVQSTIAKDHQEGSWEDHEKKLGLALSAKARDHLANSLVRVQRDEHRYVKAFTLLVAEGRMRFPKSFSDLKIENPNHLKQENLPKLPSVLQEYINKRYSFEN